MDLTKPRTAEEMWAAITNTIAAERAAVRRSHNEITKKRTEAGGPFTMEELTHLTKLSGKIDGLETALHLARGIRFD